jgi:predicted negative regulator of RcsB-dependent stress response
MAKLTARRRSALDNPEEVLSRAQSLLARVKPYTTWLVIAGVVIVVGLGAWGVRATMQANREEKAATALALVTPKVDLKVPAINAAQDLEKFVKEYPGAPAAREAQLLRANLLYRLQLFNEAAKAYESLLEGREPGWDILVQESLSYCYEGLGNFKKAAEVLKPVAEHISGPLKAEVTRRLAMLYDQAKEPKEAAVYWRKLLEQPPDPALAPYFQEKLAASEAGSQK